MGLGTITLMGMLMTPGQLPADVTPWTSPSMKIPIDYLPAKKPEIRELLLYVSPDQGQSWTQAAVADPNKDTHFTFNAQADGVYWFNMVIVHKDGHREPPDLYKVPPALKMLFDTKKPVVAVTTAQRVGDDVTVGWKVTEKNPDWSKFKLEYSLNGAAWVPVPTRPEADGMAQFKVAGPGPLAVRLSVTDVAGQIGEATSPVAGTAVAAKPDAPIIAAGGPGDPPAAGPAALPTGPAPGGALPAMPPPIPPVERAKDLRAPGDPRGADTPAAPTAPPPGFPPAPGTPGGPPIIPDSFVSPPAGPAAPRGPEPVGVSPTGPASYLPAPQVINVTSFKMAYEVEDRGASGVGKAEVWVTRDEGRTWKQWQVYEKPESPLVVNVAKGQPAEAVEGVYGFKVVLQSGAGLSRDTPKAGDVPDLRLDVDVTPPVVKIFEPVPDPTQKDTMVLRWQATDRNLATNPITLEWSSDGAKGPWFAVAATDGIGASSGVARTLPNSGAYAWKLPSNFPTHKVYLRVTARDVAGNVAEATTAQPILVDLNKPSAVKLSVTGSGR